MQSRQSSPELPLKCIKYDDVVLDTSFEVVLGALDKRLQTLNIGSEHADRTAQDTVPDLIKVMNACHATAYTEVPITDVSLPIHLEDGSSPQDQSDGGALVVSEIIREAVVLLPLPEWLITMIGKNEVILRQQAIVDRDARSLTTYAWTQSSAEGIEVRETCLYRAIRPEAAADISLHRSNSSATKQLGGSATETGTPYHSHTSTQGDVPEKTLVTRSLDVLVTMLPGIDAVVEWHVVKMHRTFVEGSLYWLKMHMDELREANEFESWSPGSPHCLGDGQDTVNPLRKLGTWPECDDTLSDTTRLSTKIITSLTHAAHPPTTNKPITSLCGALEIPPPLNLRHLTPKSSSSGADALVSSDDQLEFSPWDTSRGKALKSGTLLKYTNFFSGWQKRWFCLERDRSGVAGGGSGSLVMHLLYYESETDQAQPRGKMAVNGMEIDVVKGTVGEFTVSNGSQVFTLCAQSDKQRREWLVALGSAKAHDRAEAAPLATLLRAYSANQSVASLQREREAESSDDPLKNRDLDTNADAERCQEGETGRVGEGLESLEAVKEKEKVGGSDDEDAGAVSQSTWVDLLGELEMHDEMLRNQAETINSIVGPDGDLGGTEEFQEQSVLFRAVSKSLLTIMQDAITTTSVLQDLHEAKMADERVKRSQLKLKIQNATHRHKQLSSGLDVAEPPPRTHQSAEDAILQLGLIGEQGELPKNRTDLIGSDQKGALSASSSVPRFSDSPNSRQHRAKTVSGHLASGKPGSRPTHL